MEVYKDQLYDLLQCDDSGECIQLAGRENRHLKTLTEITVQNEQEVSALPPAILMLLLNALGVDFPGVRQATAIVQAGQRRRRCALCLPGYSTQLFGLSLGNLCGRGALREYEP